MWRVEILAPWAKGVRSTYLLTYLLEVDELCSRSAKMPISFQCQSSLFLNALNDGGAFTTSWGSLLHSSTIRNLSPLVKRRKGGCFVTGTVRSFFFVMGQIGMKFGYKTSIGVIYWTLIDEFWKCSLNGVIFPENRHFWGYFDGSQCDRPTGPGLRFLT